MSSKTSSPTTLAEAIVDALISHEYDDAVGPLKRNATDALFAIADAITRLAISQEGLLVMQEQAMARNTLMMQAMTERFGQDDDKPGHA